MMKKTALKVFDGDDYGDYGTIEAMYVRNYCLGSRVKSHSLNLYTKGSENVFVILQCMCVFIFC